MSKLYGTLQGCRGKATRCGSVSSGMRASVQSWNGSLVVYMDLNENGEPEVRLSVSDGSNCYGNDEIFRGSLDELKRKLKGD